MSEHHKQTKQELADPAQPDSSSAASVLALDLGFMSEALSEAQAARRANEVPIGAVVVYDGQVIGRGHNRRERDQDPVAHAEIFAIRQAAKVLGSWRLEQTAIYVTLEPCPMCAGAILLGRVPRLVYGCRDLKAGAVRSLYQLCDDDRLNHRLEVVEGVLQERCSQILSDFFRDIRAGRVKKPRS